MKKKTFFFRLYQALCQVLSHTLSNLILITTLQGRYDKTHFIDKFKIKLKGWEGGRRKREEIWGYMYMYS